MPTAWRLAPLLLLLTACAADPPPGEPCAAAPTLTVEGPDLVWAVDGCARLELTARALGTGNLDLSFGWSDGALRTTASGGAAGGVLQGVLLEGVARLATTEPLRFAKQGYQSWAFSGVVELEPWSLDEAGVVESGADGDSSSFLADTASSSWWMAQLGPGSGQPSLLIGALDADRHPFRVGAQPGPDDGSAEVQLVWGARGESITLGPGEELDLEPVRLDAGNDASALPIAYAAAVAERRPPPPLGPRSAVGWTTWYVFYEAVTEADVRRNLDLLAARSPTVELVQIDDGWQRVWGDWQADDGFPSGMAGLAADIRAAGFEPGLWMAPLYVDRSTSTWADHPTWWVRSPDGDELRFTNFGTGDYAVLDVTVPAASAWLTQQIADRVAEGWTWLKLDFLYAGAQEGQRALPVTGMQAYALALQAIEAGVTPDVTLLASGAPMLPSVGHFHAFRSGADIAFATDPDPRPEYLRWSARSTAARSWQNGRWWWNDPDAVLLREPFDEHQARGALIAQIVSGGAFLLGDDLPELPQGRLDAALQPELTAWVGASFTPRDPLAFASGFESSPLLEIARRDDAVPTTWTADGATALLNLSDRTVTLRAPAGRELLTGAVRDEAGDVELAAGDGQFWVDR